MNRKCFQLFLRQLHFLSSEAAVENLTAAFVTTVIGAERFISRNGKIMQRVGLPLVIRAVVNTDPTFVQIKFEQRSDSIIRIDTEGRTEGTYCGVQFGWLPTALVPDHTAYLYNVIANRNPEQLDGVSDSQIETAKDCVYSTDSTSQVKYTFSCLSANEIVSCDLLLLLDDPTIVKEGTLNGLYACWIEAYRTDRGSDVTSHFLLLYDPEKLCLVFLGGDWEVTEKIAENMTIVQTEIPTPEPSRNYIYVGAYG